MEFKRQHVGPHGWQHCPSRWFREEDVRPLWDGVRDLSGTDYDDSAKAQDAAFDLADAFPAPEEWKR